MIALVLTGESGAARAQTSPPAENTTAPVTPVTAGPDDDSRVTVLRQELFARDRIVFVSSTPLRAGVRMGATAFYEAVGRSDVAERYRNRRTAKIATLVVGGVLTGVGVVWGLGSLVGTAAENSATDFSCFVAMRMTDDPACKHSNASSFPWFLALLGGVGLTTGLALPMDPLTVDEKRGLAQTYNQRVWARISLSPSADAASGITRGMILAGVAF